MVDARPEAIFTLLSDRENPGSSRTASSKS
jgi:hypothetical protein